MKYELVLQFQSRAVANGTAMAALNAALVAALGDVGEVDGQDFGNDTINVFILTEDPAATFERAKPILERHEQLDWVIAAYRAIAAEQYTVLWPPDWRKEFRLA